MPPGRAPTQCPPGIHHNHTTEGEEKGLLTTGELPANRPGKHPGQGSRKDCRGQTNECGRGKLPSPMEPDGGKETTLHTISTRPTHLQCTDGLEGQAGLCGLHAEPRPGRSL